MNNSIHAPSAPADATEPAKGFFVVQSANVSFASDQYIADAGSLEAAVMAAAKADLPMPKYIRPGPTGYSAG